MSLVRLHAVALILVAAFVAACAGSSKPRLNVLGVEQSERVHDRRQIKLFVEVVNPARRPMRLQRLQYVFGPAGSRDAARGEIQLSRTVEGGSAVVVEVPIVIAADFDASGDMELRGQLFAEQDQVVRSYAVSADLSDEDFTGEASVVGDEDDEPADDGDIVDDGSAQDAPADDE